MQAKALPLDIQPSLPIVSAILHSMHAAIVAASIGVSNRLAVERERAASEFHSALQEREHAGGGAHRLAIFDTSCKRQRHVPYIAAGRHSRPSRLLERAADRDYGIAGFRDMGATLRWPLAPQGSPSSLPRSMTSLIAR